ncbi:MAG: MFS transporter [Thermoleophilia bacterium]|nr:MFS transporter [Thermoleophilia bacterium]
MTPGRQHYGVTLAVLTVAASAFAVQQTLVFPALPTLQRELGVSAVWATWVLTVFLLSASVLTPILGKLGDQYGKERVLVVSLTLFLAGSIGAAAAPDIGTLIVFRALAGAGGAVFPLSFGIIRDEFPPERVKVGIGLLSAVFGVGGGIGIVASGVIVDHLSWRWLFVIGAIPVAAVIVLVRRYIPESPVRSRTRVDVPGALLFAAALVCLLLGLTKGTEWGWSSPGVLGLAAAAVVLGAAFVRLELSSDHPMLDMRLMARREVALPNLTALLTGFAMFGTFVLMPQFVEAPYGLPAAIAGRVEYGFGATATMAGLYLLPSSVAMLFAGPLAGVLGRRFGSKWPLAIGLGLCAIGTGLLAELHRAPWQILVAMAVIGVGVGFSFAAMAALVTEAVPVTETGVATGMNTVMRTVGAVIGSQVMAAILTAATIPGTPVPTESAFTHAFLLAAGAAAVGAVLGLLVTPLRLRRDRHPATLALETE